MICCPTETLGRMPPRKGRKARKGSGLIKGTDYVSAVVKSGQERFCYPKDIQKLLGRPLRVTGLHVTAAMLSGTTTLVEVAIFNQGQTHVALSGPRMLVANKQTLITVTPPSTTDMWFDSGNLSSTTLKLFSLSVPCIDKSMSSFSVHFLARITYVQGEEVYDNACPTYRVLLDPAEAEQLGSEAGELGQLAMIRSAPVCRQAHSEDVE